jgi:hypothetical protein
MPGGQLNMMTTLTTPIADKLLQQIRDFLDSEADLGLWRL